MGYIERACLWLVYFGLRLFRLRLSRLRLFGCEHVKMPVETAGDNLAVVTYTVGVGKEGKRRIDQIVKIDQPAIPVQGSMTTAVGRRIAARNVSAVVKACGNQGNLFEGVPTVNKIAFHASELVADPTISPRLLISALTNRLAGHRAQIAHVALGIKKEVIQTCCPLPN